MVLQRLLAPVSGLAGVLGVLLLLGAVWPSAASAATTPLSITTTSLSSGEVGAAYSQALQATGGTPPYHWTTTSSVPAGLSFSNGTLSGRPTATMSGNLNIVVTDAASATQSATLALTIAPGPSITTLSAPDPVLGQPYSLTLAVAQGTPPYTWSVNAGPLPNGVVLNSSGVLSGLPAAVGVSVTNLAIVDGFGARVTSNLTLTVDPSPVPRAAFLVTSSTGAVSAYASPGVAVPQTGDDGPTSIVAITTDAAMDRYWLVDASGRVTSSTGTRSLGSVGGGKHLQGSVVGIAANTTGTGYWVASSTGHVYGFGAVRSFGSVPARRLSGRIVGIAANDSGTGYWLVSSTGQVYPFGTAHRLAQEGRRVRRMPNIVAITTDPVASGYWLVDRAGRVYPFGQAVIAGSIPAAAHLRSVVGIGAAPDGKGYWLALRGGAIEGLGSAPALQGVEVGADNGAVGIASAP